MLLRGESKTQQNNNNKKTQLQNAQNSKTDFTDYKIKTTQLIVIIFLLIHILLYIYMCVHTQTQCSHFMVNVEMQ